MSSELDRLLREGRNVLPEPDGQTTARARERALASVVRRRPRRARVAVLTGVAVVAAASVVLGLGAASTPSGEASKGPIGVGFLPEAGWYSLHAPTRAPSNRPQVAMAANVAFAGEDAVHGLAEPSALPYSTLTALPPRGIVIVASFVAASAEPWAASRHPKRRLPLRIADATPYIDSGTQVRPDDPLGQYQLRAAVNRRHVDVQVYFGTPRPGPARLAAAQRQLDRLVVGSAPKPATTGKVAGSSPTAVVATSVVNRTLTCPTAMVGGLYGIEARAHAGVRAGAAGWRQLPFAVVDTGNSGGRANTPELLANALAWITAGTPSNETSMETEWRSAPVRGSGTLGLNVGTCSTSKAAVALSSAGLTGGRVGPLGERITCEGVRHVVVRVRATLEGPNVSASRGLLRTQATVREARIAVRTTKGKKLVYADARDSGGVRLFAASSCEAR